MINQLHRVITTIVLTVLIACNNSQKKPAAGEKPTIMEENAEGSFGYDLYFLRKHHPDLILLGDSGAAQLIVLPAYQGRVMTSTTSGKNGKSFGWINHELIESGKPSQHINAFGGEERFWLGPEGGQFSIFFKKGTEFKFDNWYVPAEIDTDPFSLISTNKTEAKFEREMHLENYSGTHFHLLVNRTIRLLDKLEISKSIGMDIPGDLQCVAFESENSITNKGTKAWEKNTGLLSIWILSMLNASPKTTVAVPYKQGDEAKLGKIVTDDYFGKVPADRLTVNSGLMLFKADANFRSKIGVGPKRALPFIAGYDADNNVLTVAQFNLPPVADGYVNSLWKIQDNPFEGDAVNAYNDGPVDGKQMGRFYELESSSPAAALAPGKTIQHIHRTIHITGPRESLDKISMELLGVTVDKITL